jgi:hypothetical protein
MKTFDLVTLIEKTFGQFPQRRVAVTISPDLPEIKWEDDFLKKLLTEVFRTSLRSTSNQLPIHIAIHHGDSLPELEAVIGLSPASWIQIEFSGYDVWSLETLWSLEAVLQSKSDVFGYHCEERKGLKDGATRMAVFSSGGDRRPRIAVCVTKDGCQWNCNFLIPCPPDAG